MTTIRSGSKISGALGWIEYDSATDTLTMSNGTTTLTIERETAAGVSAMIAAMRGAANGIAPLGADGLIPAQHISQTVSSQVVADISARDAISAPAEAMMVTVLDASADTTVNAGAATYIRSAGAWVKIAEVESMDLVLSWDNLTGKPEAFPPATHTHATADVTGLDAALAGKLTTPTGGTTGDVLTLGADGNYAPATPAASGGMTDAERERLLKSPDNFKPNNNNEIPCASYYTGADDATLLLLHFNEAVGAATTISDSSGKSAPAISAPGTPTPSIVASPSKFGNAICFNGGWQTKGSYLITSPGRFSVSQWTVDFWVYYTGAQEDEYSGSIIEFAPGFRISLRPSTAYIYSSGGGGGISVPTLTKTLAAPMALNEWHHAAFVYQNGTLRIFINGVLDSSNTINIPATTDNSTIRVCGFYSPGGSCCFAGCIDEFRVSNVARWESDFIPPQAPHGGETKEWRYVKPEEFKALLPPEPWATLAYAAAVTVPEDAPQQKMTLTGNCALTAPTLASGQRVLLKITGNGEVMTYNATQYTINGKYLIGWYHDGDTQDCMPLREVK